MIINKRLLLIAAVMASIASPAVAASSCYVARLPGFTIHQQNQAAVDRVRAQVLRFQERGNNVIRAYDTCIRSTTNATALAACDTTFKNNFLGNPRKPLPSSLTKAAFNADFYNWGLGKLTIVRSAGTATCPPIPAYSVDIRN